KAGPPATSGPAVTFTGTVTIPDGGWIGARVIGPVSRYVSDSYAFAATSPVYVVVGGKRFTSSADAEFLGKVVDAIWQRLAARGNGGRAAEKETFKGAIDQAREVYRRIADHGRVAFGHPAESGRPGTEMRHALGVGPQRQ